MTPIISGGRVQSGLDREDVRYTFRAVYDFAVLTGAQASYDLLDENGKSVTLPDNFVVERATVTTHTALTSGGAATVAIGSSEAGKGAIIMAATAFNVAPFDADTKALHCAALVTTPYKVTGTSKTLQATIAGANLTAGKFEVVIHGYAALG